jgi:Txe/YoeB family toxin of toxin-antitoxin system
LKLGKVTSTGKAKTEKRFGVSTTLSTTLSKTFNALLLRGSGSPNRSKGNLSGFWSRRIDETNRLVYEITDAEIAIVSCRYHY